MRRLLVVFGMVLLAGSSGQARNATVSSLEAASFMGTWVLGMTEPDVLRGSQQTIRTSDRNGTVAASLQVGRFPPTDITGAFKDGDMLVLTTTLRENGAPIWAVVALTVDGSTMTMAQMLQNSQTIKRGTGRKQQG